MRADQRAFGVTRVRGAAGLIQMVDVRGPYGAADRLAGETVLIPMVASLGRLILRRVADDVRIRPMTELDIEGITRIDERITKRYRPEVWEERVGYYLRRDAESSQVAEVAGSVVGFMMGEVRGGEFGLEEPTGWIEFFGVDPEVRGRDLGRRLIDALLAHFRTQGAHIARTMVAASDRDVAGFLRAMQFTPAPLTALEKRL
jgi:ribosomal protein S18 acetylase RimI-like enzyme